MTGSVGAQRGAGAGEPAVSGAHGFRPSEMQTFRYVGWELSWDAEQAPAPEPGGRGTAVHVRLRYSLEAEHHTWAFTERFTFPFAAGGVGSDHEPVLAAPGSALAAALDVLLVCAGTSYFKAAAPPAVEGVPDWLLGFSEALYLHGLAEFAFVNDLDPVRPRLAASVATAPTQGPRRIRPVRSVEAPLLVAVGGGKDSIVTIEALRRSSHPLVLGSVRSHRAINATARTAGLPHLVIDRVLDPALLALNDQGALNGHIPVTAINSAALAVCAVLNGYPTVVMSNEWSASVPIAEHRGLPVNHQWSKSLECERLLADLLPVEYFSFLRPLHEVEICRRFAQLPRYFDVVTSCNRAYTAVGRAAGTRWCGDCPKCRFVYLGLAPFLAQADMDRIFEGARLLGDAQPDAAILDAYRAILGMAGEPPLECVGTVSESRWAMRRLAGAPGSAVDPVWASTATVRTLVAELDALGPDTGAMPSTTWDPLAERGEHAVPEEFHALQ